MVHLDSSSRGGYGSGLEIAWCSITGVRYGLELVSNSLGGNQSIPWNKKWKCEISKILFSPQADQVFQSDEPGDDGSDDDDSYWDQYDQVTGQASALGDTENTLPDVRPSDNGLKSEENHYNQYDNIETTIGDSNLMQDAGQKTVQQPAESIGAAGIADPVDRNEVHDIGLDDYIRSTVRNLGRLAMRCGMPKQRLTELINDAINNA